MNPSIYAAGTAAGATGNSGFWGSIANKLGSMGATTAASGTSGSLSSSGGTDPNKYTITGNQFGDAALSMGTIGLSSLVGGMVGGGDSGGDKYTSQKAHSEGVTRKFEAKNTVPSTALGNYMARALALQGMPVLGMLNNLDFMAKLLGYGGDYYPKSMRFGNKALLKTTQGIGNLLKGRRR